MSTTPLKAGDRVTLLHERVLLNGKREERVIGYAGGVGFTIKGGGPTYWWHERGATWASDSLDRQDEARAKFKEAALGRERNT
jgi:hypothetical protein